MPFNFGVGRHPQTNQAVAFITAEPEPLPPMSVLAILRMIKQEFPKLFEQVQLELYIPTNGHPGLVIPDDISKKEDG